MNRLDRVTLAAKQLALGVWRAPLPVTPAEWRASRQGPRVLYNSLPKSGTHLLGKVISLLPLVASRWTFHVVRQTPDLKARLHGVRRGQCCSAHLPWDAEIAGVVAAAGLRHILIVRDPRDVVVSNAFYITAMNTSHRLSAYYQALSSDDARIMASITGISGELLPDGQAAPGIGAWVRLYAAWAQEPGCLMVRFEDLVGAAGGGDDHVQLQTVGAIAAHVGLRLGDEELRRVAASAFDRNTSTFRRGQIGSWRQHFSQDHRLAFAEVAGDVLAEWGYV